MTINTPRGTSLRGYVRSFPASDPWRICQVCQALWRMSGTKSRATTPICWGCEKDQPHELGVVKLEGCSFLEKTHIFFNIQEELECVEYIQNIFRHVESFKGEFGHPLSMDIFMGTLSISSGFRIAMAATHASLQETLSSLWDLSKEATAF